MYVCMYVCSLYVSVYVYSLYCMYCMYVCILLTRSPSTPDSRLATRALAFTYEVTRSYCEGLTT